MPYVITTRRNGPDTYQAHHGSKFPCASCGEDGYISVPHSCSRRAVATLEEAIRAVRQFAPDDSRLVESGTYEDHAPLEDGFTVGPLPDGTVIEVAPMDWRHLIRASGIARRQPSYWFAVTNPTAEEKSSALDAFNAQESVA
jgi:hypothetical protein